MVMDEDGDGDAVAASEELLLAVVDAETLPQAEPEGVAELLRLPAPLPLDAADALCDKDARAVAEDDSVAELQLVARGLEVAKPVPLLEPVVE